MSENSAFLWNYMGGLPDSGGATSKNFKEGVRLLEQLEFDKALKKFKDAEESTSSTGNRAALIILSGNALAGMGKLNDAISNYRDADKLSQEIQDRECRLVAVYNMGNLERARGGLGLAADLLKIALEIADQTGNARAMADINDVLGDIAMSISNNEEAYTRFFAAYELEKGMNDAVGMAYHMSCLGHLFHLEGELDKAIEKYQQSLSLNESANDQWGEANCLDRLAAIFTELHDIEEAGLCNDRALELFEELGDARGEAGARLTKGVISAMESDMDTAIEEIEKALTMFSAIGDKTAQSNCFYELGNVYHENDDFENAEIFYAKALKGYEETRMRMNQADVYSSLGRIKLDCDDLKGAKELFSKSISISRDENDIIGEANTMQYLANTCFYMKQYDEAIKLLTASKEIYAKAGDIDGIKMAEKNMQWVVQNRPHSS